MSFQVSVYDFILRRLQQTGSVCIVFKNVGLLCRYVSMVSFRYGQATLCNFTGNLSMHNNCQVRIIGTSYSRVSLAVAIVSCPHWLESCCEFDTHVIHTNNKEWIMIKSDRIRRNGVYTYLVRFDHIQQTETPETQSII